MFELTIEKKIDFSPFFTVLRFSMQRFDGLSRVIPQKIERSLLYKIGYFLSSQMLPEIGEGPENDVP